MAVFPLSAKHRLYALRACRFDYFGVGGIHCFDREDRSPRQTAARGTKGTAAAVLGRQRCSDGILGAGGGAGRRLAGGRAGAFGYGAGRNCPNNGKIWRRKPICVICVPTSRFMFWSAATAARREVQFFTDEDGERTLVALEKKAAYGGGRLLRRICRFLPTLRSVVVKTSALGSLARAEVPVEIRESLSGIFSLPLQP